MKPNKVRHRRAPNFSKTEMTSLLALVEKYRIRIGDKHLDHSSRKEKQKAWAELTVEFNENSTSHHRTAENLKSCYRNHLMDTKLNKEFSDIRAKIIEAGVSPKDEKIDNVKIETESHEEASVSTDDNDIDSKIDWDTIFLRGFDKPLPRRKRGYTEMSNTEMTITKLNNHINNANMNSIHTNIVDMNNTQVNNTHINNAHNTLINNAHNTLINNAHNDDQMNNAHMNNKSEEKATNTDIQNNRPREIVTQPNVIEKVLEPGDKKDSIRSFEHLIERKKDLIEIRKQIHLIDLAEKQLQSRHNAKIRQVEIAIKEMELELLRVKVEREVKRHEQ